MLGSDIPVTTMMIATTTANSVKLNPAFELTFSPFLRSRNPVQREIESSDSRLRFGKRGVLSAASDALLIINFGVTLVPKHSNSELAENSENSV